MLYFLYIFEQLLRFQSLWSLCANNLNVCGKERHLFADLESILTQSFVKKYDFCHNVALLCLSAFLLLVWKAVIEPSFLDSHHNICIASGQKSCNLHLPFLRFHEPRCRGKPSSCLLIALLFSRALGDWLLTPKCSQVTSRMLLPSQGHFKVIPKHWDILERFLEIGTAEQGLILFFFLKLLLKFLLKFYSKCYKLETIPCFDKLLRWCPLRRLLTDCLPYLVHSFLPNVYLVL